MQSQVIDLKGYWYCTVFRIVDKKVDVVDKTRGESLDEIQLWLSQMGYPRAGILLREKVENTVPGGWYIKPHAANAYFRVSDPGNQLTPVAASLFDSPVPIP
jgi:hypothetical protein